MMKIIKINLGERTYPVIITGEDFKILINYIKKTDLGTDAFIITNPFIYKLYGDSLQTHLKTIQITSHFYTVKDSEKSKSISEYIKIIKQISQIDTKKRIFLIALGGGVIGDLCGFVAATYKRGINYIQIPTTLLAQVDSSIGGKTAIDLPSGKNLIGAFYQPRFVYSNISLLKSLPVRQIKCGLAEVIKYGIIADKNLFSFLENNYQKILELDTECLMHIVSISTKIKAKIVELDERETKGLRTILNFGHTIGHAIETASRYENLTHGEAISIGMICAAQISLELGILDKKIFQTIHNLFRCLELPANTPKISFKAILNAFYRDKKFIHGKIRMVIPVQIGHVMVTENIPFNLIKTIIKKQVM